jgi:hypothetical protein
LREIGNSIGRSEILEMSSTERSSIVLYLWKEVPPTFWRHVEEAPERINKIARATSFGALGVRAADYQLGTDASSDVLRQRARCTGCGNLGATLRHPSWSGDIHRGDSPFPVERF